MVSRVFTLPPPPLPSTRFTKGSLKCSASFKLYSDLFPILASAAPPLTVKSSPATTTSLPSTVPLPNMKFAGVNSLISPSSS